MLSLTVLINARKDSSRCHNKMLRVFASTTLFDIAADKLSQLHNVDKAIGIHENFKVKCPSNITVCHRSLESVTCDGPLSLVYETAQQMSTTHFMFLNPSCAHIRVETIQSAIDFFLSNDWRSLTSVVKDSGWLFDSMGNSIICHTGGDTKKDKWFYRVAHVFHIFDRVRLLQTECIWSYEKGDPFLFEIPHEESLDIDTDYDFMVSESVYKRSHE